MASPPNTNQGVLSSQYFLYFGVLGIILPYFNLYLFHIGLDAFQIGIVSGVRSAAVVVLPLLWGIAADRTGRRKPLFVLFNAGSAALFALYFTVRDFHPLLAVTLAWSVFYAPIISFMEAFSMEILGADRNRYGHVRVWGTIAFVIMALCLGPLVEARGVRIILGLILAGSAAQAVLSLKMPAAPPRPRKKTSSRGMHFFTREVIVFQASAFLMLLSHGAYYGFFSIHLEEMGFSSTFIGTAWALASMAEMGVMLRSDRILDRFHPRKVLFASLCVAVIRWAVMIRAASPAVLYGAQLLHAATYGSFHIASIVYMERLIPPESRTAGQAVNNSVTYGLGMMAGFFISGAVFEKAGAGAAFGLCALAAALGALLFGLFGEKRAG